MMRWIADRTRCVYIYIRTFIYKFEDEDVQAMTTVYLVQCRSCFLVHKCQQVRRRAPQDLLDTQHRWWKGWFWFVGKSDIQDMFPTAVIFQCKMGTSKMSVFSTRKKRVDFPRIFYFHNGRVHWCAGTQKPIGFKFPLIRRCGRRSCPTTPIVLKGSIRRWLETLMHPCRFWLYRYCRCAMC